MWRLVKETYQLIKINLKHLLVFEIVYRLITGPIFLQLFNRALRFSLKQAGYSYLTMGNAWRFLLKPWTLVMILCVGAIGVLFIMVEVGGLITAYSSGAYSLRLGPLDIFLGGIHNLIDQVKKKNVKLFGVVLVQFLLISVYLIYRVLTHVKPLNFVMKTMLEESWGTPLVVVTAVAFTLIAIPSVFTPHSCMIEQKSFRDSMNRSRDLLKGRLFKTVFRLVVCQALVVLCLVGAYLLCVTFAGILVVLLVDKNLEFAFLMEVQDRIEWVLLFVAGVMSCLIHFGAVTVQYYQYNNRMHHEKRWDFNYFPGKASNRKNLVAGLVVIAGASLACMFDTAYNGNVFTKSMVVETEITAHRGSSKTAPENTMAAVMAAVEELADRVEIDVQETSDGRVVLFHDGTLKRITGLNKRVADLSYEELLTLDVGAWFSEAYEGERIPTLEEVMEFAKGKIDLNIEIKNLGTNSHLPEKVLKLVHEYGMEEQCVITSTNIQYLYRIKEANPEIRTGFILSAAYGDYYSDELIDFISIRSSFVTENMIGKSHEAGKTVHAWTVNNRSEMERLKVLGVDNIITDYPVLVREVLYREEVTENLLEYLRVLLK